MGPAWTTSEAFADRPAFYRAVSELGLEGVVAERLDGRYRPGECGWVKIKSPNHW